MPVNIQLEWTPNPSTLKYVVDRKLLASGAVNITSKEMAAEKSPLAKRLMDINGVTAVMVGLNFVTVTKGDEGEWDELNDEVMSALDTHLGENQPVLTEAAAAEVPAGPADALPAPVIAVPPPQPPSQAEIAARVAGDVARDLVPPSKRPWVIGGGLLLLGVVGLLLGRACGG